MIIGFPHRPQALGGPGSFQLRLTAALEGRGHTIVYPGESVWPDAVLVVGGTARLGWLRACKQRGARIVHRLDGLNWRHRVVWTGLRHQFMSEVRNGLMIHIRNQLADEVVYQSKFVRDWWHGRYGRARGEEQIIYNSVDLELFRPGTQHYVGKPVMVAVEGAIQGDPATIATVRHLATSLVASGEIAALRLYGQATPEIREVFTRIQGVEMAGSVPREQMPVRLRSCDLFLNLEINPPCPNSVIEALATGLPVIGYDTGALAELTGSGGCLAHYGADPWLLQQPSLELLVAAARQVLASLPAFSESARSEACQRFSMSNMVDAYMVVLKGNGR